MNSNIDIAKKYFELSNQKDLKGIESMMTEQTTYSSQNTGIYLGAKKIIEMQKSFFDSFQELNWDIQKIVEIKSGIIKIDFVLIGTHTNGELVRKTGIEHIVIFEGKLQHIEVRNN